MKRRFVGVVASVALLLVPSSLDTVRCEPETYSAPAGAMVLYDFHHDFKTLVAAAKEVERRVRLCGDPSMQPLGPSPFLPLDERPLRFPTVLPGLRAAGAPG